ncbi:hypothetical protein NIES4103_62620 [Nostoc sp. NIES-4103]|nr:hypothetical protein NIES4103_62620 [Nostoc sp. NIES-4103]
MMNMKEYTAITTVSKLPRQTCTVLALAACDLAAYVSLCKTQTSGNKSVPNFFHLAREGININGTPI